MHVVIVGGGGLGTVIAAHLARGGCQVTLLVKPAQAANAGGTVRVSGLSDFSAPARTTSEAATVGACDALIVCVKARDTEAALMPLRGISADAVLSLQNGVVKDDILERVFGPERVLGALTGIGGTLLEPGHARHTLNGVTRVGELDGRMSERAERIAGAFRAGGLSAECVNGIRTFEWQKLAVFLRTALVCSLTHLDIGSVLVDDDLRPVCIQVAREVAAVASAEGHELARLPVWIGPSVTFGDSDAAIDADLVRIGRALHDQGVPLYPSLAQDTMAGRPSEIEATAGDVVARAAVRGVPAPSLWTCYHLVRAHQRRIMARASSGQPGFDTRVDR
jgi:2-dehydropantoate 2-reductase